MGLFASATAQVYVNTLPTSILQKAELRYKGNPLPSIFTSQNLFLPYKNQFYKSSPYVPCTIFQDNTTYSAATIHGVCLFYLGLPMELRCQLQLPVTKNRSTHLAQLAARQLPDRSVLTTYTKNTAQCFYHDFKFSLEEVLLDFGEIAPD